ncbi:MAG: transcription antitermination factor NusB [Candidatus Aminicenantes bacterium]|nr:transcription antitermination factor NusB [Candidatus Aminicenantes bacterium]
MGKRRRARESTLQILYQLEFNDTAIDNLLKDFAGQHKLKRETADYTFSLVNGVLKNKKSIDDLIRSISVNWRMSRMAVVDRNILRIAAFELMYGENINPAVVINEAIEIAKKYSSEKSARFINGILDALRNKQNTLKEHKEENDHGEEKTDSSSIPETSGRNRQERSRAGAAKKVGKTN